MMTLRAISNMFGSKGTQRNNQTIFSVDLVENFGY